MAILVIWWNNKMAPPGIMAPLSKWMNACHISKPHNNPLVMPKHLPHCFTPTWLICTLPASWDCCVGHHSDNWHSSAHCRSLRAWNGAPPPKSLHCSGGPAEASPVALHGAQLVDTHSDRLLLLHCKTPKALQPAHCIHLVSPSCFYPHISTNAQVHTPTHTPNCS